MHVQLVYLSMLASGHLILYEGIERRVHENKEKFDDESTLSSEICIKRSFTHFNTFGLILRKWLL